MSNFVSSDTLVRQDAIPSGPPHSLREWFAIHTTSRHEKRIAEHLSVRRIETFLPLYSSVRSWKNGCKVKVELPLFPCYLFVRLSRQDKSCALQIPGVLSFVGIAGQPAALAESEIDALRSGIQALNCEPHPYLVVGERVRIMHGPLAGIEGVLARKKGALRVVISLNLIMKSIAVEVDAADVEPVGITVSCPPTA